MKRQTKKAVPPKSDLQGYFSTFLFKWVRASNEKTHSESKPLKAALNYKYIDPNNNGYIRVLTVDVDWDIPMEEYIDRIPLPNAIVSNPENGHVQIMYFLQSRVYRENAKIMYAYQMIRDNLNRALKGDFGFVGRLQKNPLHSYWNTTWFNGDPYRLTDLINWSMKQEFDMGGDCCRAHDFTSRNETVFHSLLKYACRRHKDLTYEILESYAEYLNNLIPEFDTTIKVPLAATELRGIVRSVWKFMKTRYTGRSKRGEGQYTEEQRERSIVTRTAKKWQNIHRFIEYRKMNLSLKRIAKVMNVTLKTIKNYASASRPDPSFAGSSFSRGHPLIHLFSGAGISLGHPSPLVTPLLLPDHLAPRAMLNKTNNTRPPPPPPVLPTITDTVFQWTGRLTGTDKSLTRKVIQNSS